MTTKAIGQIIIDGSFDNENSPNLINGANVVQLGVFALPGCTIEIDGNTIVINSTGLLQIDELPIEAGISSLKVTDNTINLLAAAGTKLIIDYVSMQEIEESEE